MISYLVASVIESLTKPIPKLTKIEFKNYIPSIVLILILSLMEQKVQMEIFGFLN